MNSSACARISSSESACGGLEHAEPMVSATAKRRPDSAVRRLEVRRGLRRHGLELTLVRVGQGDELIAAYAATMAEERKVASRARAQTARAMSPAL